MVYEFFFLGYILGRYIKFIEEREKADAIPLNGLLQRWHWQGRQNKTEQLLTLR
jgi:hypothetical protein